MILFATTAAKRAIQDVIADQNPKKNNNKKKIQMNVNCSKIKIIIINKNKK